jgi:hypothetical protein
MERIHEGCMADRSRCCAVAACTIALLLSLLIISIGPVLAHGIGGKDASFVAATKGPDILPFMYLGAKHMVTGYDHLLSTACATSSSM